jgi:hypothetical protein
MADYIDQILHSNAESWDDEKPFMTYAEIRGKCFGDIQEKFPMGEEISPTTTEQSCYPDPQQKLPNHPLQN